LPDVLLPYVGFVNAHPYLSLFVGMLIAGELVLLPAIYMSATGQLEIAYVICIAIASTLIKDFGFYYAGRTVPASALQRIPGHSTSKLVKGLDTLFRQRGPEVLFLSKFVYGTRMIAQILAGVHAMPVRVYLIANTLGTAALTLALSVIAWSVTGTTRQFGDAVHSAELAFFLFVLIASIAYVSVATIARRRWSQ
jgi:membrane protein DedA with SNARE-associated domain